MKLQLVISQVSLLLHEHLLDYVVILGGKDIVDYPLTILPRNHGSYSGAMVFVALR